MKTFTALQMQQASGEIHRAALVEPVLVTHHGRANLAVMSIEEFVRLKQAADEIVPTEAQTRSRPMVRSGPADDALGYDTSDLQACALAMARDALDQGKAPARAAEIAAVERRFGFRK